MNSGRQLLIRYAQQIDSFQEALCQQLESGVNLAANTLPEDLQTIVQDAIEAIASCLADNEWAKFKTAHESIEYDGESHTPYEVHLPGGIFIKFFHRDKYLFVGKTWEADKITHCSGLWIYGKHRGQQGYALFLGEGSYQKGKRPGGIKPFLFTGLRRDTDGNGLPEQWTVAELDRVEEEALPEFEARKKAA